MKISEKYFYVTYCIKNNHILQQDSLKKCELLLLLLLINMPVF